MTTPTGHAVVSISHEGSGRDGSLVLVHGLGSTGRSWAGFGAALPERVAWVAVDLPGHGQAGAGAPYSFGAMASVVARACENLPAPVTIVGHSLGGAVALLVGSGLFGATIARVVALDTKVRWTDHELERASAVAAKPPKTFGTREEAGRFWQLVAGVPVGAALDEALEADVLREDGGTWRLAYDPAVAALGAAPVHSLVDLCVADVQLVRGANDPMVSDEDIAMSGALAPITVPDCGHSPHVERPDELVRLLGFATAPDPGDGSPHQATQKDENAL